jgi:WD repeat-containing protein 23
VAKQSSSLLCDFIMEDPWSAMGEEEDETYTGPDAYLDDDDDDDTQGTDLDMEIEDEVVQLEEEAESFSSLFNRLGPDTVTVESETVITNDHIGRLLATMPITRLARIFGVPARAGRDEDDDDDDEEWGYPRLRSPGNLFQKVTEPQPAGVKLLLSGDFGRVRNRLLPERKRNLYGRLRDASRKPGPVYKEDLAHDMVPNTHGTAVATYDANVYCGQYSAGSFSVQSAYILFHYYRRLFLLLHLCTR